MYFFFWTPGLNTITLDLHISGGPQNMPLLTFLGDGGAGFHDWLSLAGCIRGCYHGAVKIMGVLRMYVLCAAYLYILARTHSLGRQQPGESCASCFPFFPGDTHVWAL